MALAKIKNLDFNGPQIFLTLLLVANTEGSLYAVLWIRYYIGEINILGARDAS